MSKLKENFRTKIVCNLYLSVNSDFKVTITLGGIFSNITKKTKLKILIA